MRIVFVPENAPVRGLLGLLTARRVHASRLLVRTGRAIAAVVTALLICAAAAAPPDSDDPNRQHLDPGVWPILIFIVALFVFALVIRGSRPRRRPGPAATVDRRSERAP